jgi:hypothetical protein
MINCHLQKNRWLIWGLLLDLGTPVNIPSSLALVSMALNPSTHIRNRYRDKGSPYLIPRDRMIFPHGVPLTRTKSKYWVDVTHIIIKRIHRSSNPIPFITASKNLHSTWSYALLISCLTVMNPFFPLHTYMHRVECLVCRKDVVRN